MLIPRANSTAAATCITNTNAAADAAATARSRRRRSARAPRRRKRAVALAGLTVLFALREFRSAARTAANHPFFVPETAPSVATLLQRHGHHHHRDDDDSNNNNNNNETIIIDRDEPRAVATAPATGNYNKTNNNNSNTVLNYGERRAAMTATATTTTTTTNATESAAATISSSKMQQQSLRKEVVQPRDGDGGGGETFQKGAGRFRIKGADGSGSILPPAAVAPSRLAVPFGAAALASGGTPLAAGQLHRWQSSRGIDLRGLLHFVNESNAGDLLGSETPYLKNQGPFPAFIVHTAKGGVQLWISLSAIERRRKSSLALRLRKIHRFFNQALQDIAPSATDTDTTNTNTAHTAHTANTNITTAVGNDYPALSRVMRTAGILPLALQLDDYIKCPKDNHRVENGGKPITVPLFTLCSSLDCPNSLAVPTYSMLDYTMGYDSPEEWARQFRNWSAAYPWEDKVPKLYWRGSCTYYRNIYKFNSIRARILRLSTREEVRELVDIHPTQPDNCPERGPGGNVTLASRSEPEESMKHRAVLDMDGNSWSERFPRLLCFNSAVVKMEPRYADYLWTTVKPWVHYVPATAEDFDRVARFVASDENQDALKRIVGNANAWCARRMRRSGMKRDLLTIVDGYVRELDRHDPAWLDWWSENYRSYTNEGKQDFFSTFRLNTKRMALEARDLDPSPMRNTKAPPRAVRRENAR